MGLQVPTDRGLLRSITLATVLLHDCIDMSTANPNICHATPVIIVRVHLNSDVLVRNKMRKCILRFGKSGLSSLRGVDIGKPDPGKATGRFKRIPIDNVGYVLHNFFLLIHEPGMTNSIFSFRAQLHDPDTVSKPYRHNDMK